MNSLLRMARHQLDHDYDGDNCSNAKEVTAKPMLQSQIEQRNSHFSSC
jgi:hypothetical protein